MRHILIVFTLFAATGVFAQDKNPVTSVVKEILQRQQKNLVAGVEEMPAEARRSHRDEAIFRRIGLGLCCGE